MEATLPVVVVFDKTQMATCHFKREELTAFPYCRCNQADKSAKFVCNLDIPHFKVHHAGCAMFLKKVMSQVQVVNVHLIEIMSR